MQAKKLAILIINWNGLGETVACLDSILENKPSFLYDIYVLDNGSKNNEADKLIEKYKNIGNFLLIRSDKNLGFAGGNNRLFEEAAKVADYEYFFLLNNDTEISLNFLDNFIKKVNNRVGIFGPQVRYFEKKDIIQSVGGYVNLWTGICRRKGDKKFANDVPDKDLEFECDYIFGCAILISSDVIKKIGSLENDYFIYYEEVDFCQKAKKRNLLVKYIPVEGVYHKDSVSTRRISGFHIYTMFRNRIIFLKRNSSFFKILVSYLYLFAYFIYFTFKYGIIEGYFLAKGSIDGIIGKIGNPLDYQKF